MQRPITKNFKDILKLDNDRSKNKRYCKCGHSIVFAKTSKTDKTICSHCGNYIFKNDFLEFEYYLKKKIKKEVI